MKPINPRSGHGIGPSSNEPWYVRFVWALIITIVTAAYWVKDAWNFILELFKI